MRITLILLVFYSTLAHSKWLCSTTASVASGNIMTACGIGTAKSEQSARTIAADEAQKEFNRFCQNSSHCLKKETIAREKFLKSGKGRAWIKQYIL